MDLTALRDEITGALGGLGLVGAVVEIEVVDRLRRDQGAAKLRRFVRLAAGARRDPDGRPAGQHPAGASAVGSARP